MNRQEVYQAIDGERKYQDSKWDHATTTRNGRPAHSLTEWLVFMNDYVQEGLRNMTRTPDVEANPFARHTIRKVVALGVAALEEHGALTREQEGPRPIGARK